VTAHRDAIVRALKQVFVADIRAKGFKGSFPHFRRVGTNRVDYLTVQFSKYGGSFVVEIATADGDGKPQGYGQHLAVEKLNVYYFGNRLRLGSNPEAGIADHWYAFGPANYDVPEPFRSFEYYLDIARQVTADFERQAEPWFMANAGTS
jgi:hypothetical protein